MAPYLKTHQTPKEQEFDFSRPLALSRVTSLFFFSVKYFLIRKGARKQDVQDLTFKVKPDKIAVSITWQVILASSCKCERS